MIDDTDQCHRLLRAVAQHGDLRTTAVEYIEWTWTDRWYVIAQMARSDKQVAPLRAKRLAADPGLSKVPEWFDATAMSYGPTVVQ